MKERTFVMIKPDGVERNLIGEIIRRYEQAGLKVVALKMVKLSEDIVAKHYPQSMALSIAEKAKKSMGKLDMTPEEYGNMVLKGLREYITSGPVVCMVLEGENAVEKVRKVTGFTDPSRAERGTVRGDLGEDSFEKANAERRSVRNLVHASDSLEIAKAEISRFFSELEITR